MYNRNRDIPIHLMLTKYSILSQKETIILNFLPKKLKRLANQKVQRVCNTIICLSLMKMYKILKMNNNHYQTIPINQVITMTCLVMMKMRTYTKRSSMKEYMESTLRIKDSLRQGLEKCMLLSSSIIS